MGSMILEKADITCKTCGNDVVIEHFDIGNQIAFACLACRWAQRIEPIRPWKCDKCFKEDKLVDSR